MEMWIKVVEYSTVVVCSLHIKCMLGLTCWVHIKALGHDFTELDYMKIFYVSQCMLVQSPSLVQLYLYMYSRSYFYSTTCFGLTPSSGTLSLG
jgi:hypothetical protein